MELAVRTATCKSLPVHTEAKH